MLEQSVQTQTELLNDGMIARSELLETQNNLSSAQIELNRINQNFELFQAGANGKFHITAPKTGYIIQKNISAGQTLTSDNERSEEHTSELQSRPHLVCRLLLEKKK